MHAEESQCVLPVLDRCIIGPVMRESLEPYEPRPIDLPGYLERNRLRSQYVCGTHNEHDILMDTGKTGPCPVPREVCLRLSVDALGRAGFEEGKVRRVFLRNVRHAIVLQSVCRVVISPLFRQRDKARTRDNFTSVTSGHSMIVVCRCFSLIYNEEN
jgi:hypothetical protein